MRGGVDRGQCALHKILIHFHLFKLNTEAHTSQRPLIRDAMMAAVNIFFFVLFLLSCCTQLPLHNATPPVSARCYAGIIAVAYTQINCEI